ncbi:MAG: DUF3127 domain-containing protein [Bacteroidaceae bacterium]|nr:DUF3127 domain-containing protein [Bacteroidaceae bacterium]
MLLENIKIITVSEERSGESTTTGKAWCQRNVLLGFEDETGESYMFAQVDGDVWRKLGYNKGDVASLHVRFRTKKFASGWVANDIRIVDPQNLKGYESAS